MRRFRHLILTRFNVRIDQCDPPDPDWLEHRFAVFERFCLPSVRSQTSANFDWVVFCHPGMPAAMRERIQDLCAWKAFRPIYFSSVFDQAMVRAAISDLLPGFSHVITTRLDNDDAISRTFVETLQKNFTGQDLEFLNFTNGYIWHEGGIYFGQNLSNPFISLVERVENYRTVYCGNHTELDQVGPVVQIAEPAAWLQVVHGRNLSNEAWGWQQAFPDWREHFGISD
jgi:hypothetical protein